MKLSSLQVDAEVVEVGQWVKDLPELDDLQLRVRGLENEQYRRLRATLIKAIPRARRRDGTLSVEDSERINATLLLETVLLDWKGLDDGSGKPIPFSKDLARDLLFKPENRRFRDAVSYAASLVGEAIAEEEDADAKN